MPSTLPIARSLDHEEDGPDLLHFLVLETTSETLDTLVTSTIKEPKAASEMTEKEMGEMDGPRVGNFRRHDEASCEPSSG